MSIAPLVDRHGLTEEEYGLVGGALGREPNAVELGMFGAMWSEHCAYKHSRPLLAGLPTTGPRVLVGPGENAGALDIGDGLAVVFKVESHNHPSAVEPYQGAATGVGGIIRDVFTMGARPIALLNSLRFGPLDPAEDASGRTDADASARNRYLFDGVVAGIAGYGNCIGIPDVAGELHFDASFTGNPLVNAMCVGIARHQAITLARAAGPGNALLLVGAATGRDGIQGASFASAALGEDRDERRPAVQVGDPFLEKLLLEACLELSGSDAVVAMQDLGAAGLTCALAELSSRGGCGAEVDLDLVPTREDGMSAYELLLSESQERMLIVVKAGREDEVRSAFERYELHAVTIGRVIAQPVVRARLRGDLVCEVRGRALVDDAPRYIPPAAPPAGLEARRAEALDDLAAATPSAETLPELLASPNASDRKPIWRRYDHMNGTNTLVGPGAGDAALLRVKGTGRAIALSLDGPGRLGALDPRLAGAAAVIEGALNVACSGATPIGITNCLNFGSPETPVGYWQLSEAVAGMADACRALELPIVSGNVSLYNEGADGPILPTPVIGTVGLLEDRSAAIPMRWRVGDPIWLLGAPAWGPDALAGSELAWRRGRFGGRPSLDVAAAARLVALLVDLASGRRIVGAHDLAVGGLAVALARLAMASGSGARVVLGTDAARLPTAALFGERTGRVLVAVAPEQEAVLGAAAAAAGVDATPLGKAGGGELVMTAGSVELRWGLAELERAWSTPL
ncbi:MAG TPA: phosphoribosylformylglycinamidine synthase subunit PurL [Candidatus Dormibacteraeota bacterium]|nr:phosphoribosylformylglycinamidine synthase subunit PurL [Candidatus Dormibacteraeota bacterium]